MAKTRLLMVAGERSGDLYGAALARALKARLGDVEIFGCGGEAMRAAGVETLVDSHSIAVAGIVEVLPGLARIYRAYRLLVREGARCPPALAILIDFPDFNLRLARALKRKNIPIVYFVSPQIWAWRKGRIKPMKRVVSRMLCLFDFEREFYRAAGVPVEWVGHPLVDRVKPQLSRAEFFARAGLDPQKETVALLPGSRRGEVSRILPAALRAAARIAAERPVQFALALAPTIDLEWIDRILAKRLHGSATVRTLRDLTGDVLAHCDAAIVASGTATLEAALAGCPMVVVYRVSPVTWWVGKLLVRVPHYSMVNLLAGRAVVPELMQRECSPRTISDRTLSLLRSREARETMKTELRNIRARLGPPGAAERAADAIARFLPAPAGHPIAERVASP